MAPEAIKIPNIQDNDYSFSEAMNSLVQEPRFTVGSLFAGIGGIDIGFKNSGFDISWANEIDSKAVETYRANHDSKIICKDIKELSLDEIEKVDILTAGFPCQAFSVAGYRKGFNDARGSIFFELLRFIDYIKPKAILLENVKNLLSHAKGKTFQNIKEALMEAGYHLQYEVLNTCEYSEIPQNRERVYIVAFRNSTHCNKFQFPRKTNKKLTVKDMLEKEVDDVYYYNNTKYYPILKQEITNDNTCYQWRRKYVRENKNNLCPTLTANMGTGGHNVPLVKDDKDIRKLTPRECARLQGFKDSFKLPYNLAKSALYKQIGNSVSVPVIEKIAKNILIALQYD